MEKERWSPSIASPSPAGQSRPMCGNITCARWPSAKIQFATSGDSCPPRKISNRSIQTLKTSPRPAETEKSGGLSGCRAGSTRTALRPPKGAGCCKIRQHAKRLYPKDLADATIEFVSLLLTLKYIFGSIIRVPPGSVFLCKSRHKLPQIFDLRFHSRYPWRSYLCGSTQHPTHAIVNDPLPQLLLCC